ncbi:MAG: undecaprenyl-phosphate glucose phosphotransferase [Oscillospiraceae bacterium]|nr:undecaprenyl-phosphate glucose phosphotransferase [Oscillospiraceae bacterium]
MIKRNQKLINILNMLSDCILIFFSYYLALFFRFIVFDGKISLMLWKYPYSLAMAIYSIAIVFVYRICRMYGSYRFKAVGEENISISAINGFGIITLMATMYIFHMNNFSRGVLVLYWGISSIIIIAKRFAVRHILHHYRRLGYNQKHVIIVGNGHHAFQYVNDLKNNPQVGITVDGYVSKVEKDGLGKCLGSYEELESILQENDIDELVVALEPHEIHFMKYVIGCADKEGVRLSLIPFFNDYFPSNVRIEKLGKSKLIDMRATPLDNILGATLKRVMDIVGSAAGLIILSPLLIVIAMGVKLSSPGPVLFKQDRIGLHKKPFKMLKFRSMRVNDSETTGWSTNKDPRKTLFGSIIRKFSLDELRQLVNVFKGDMSLVGPRPEVPHYVRQFKEDVPLYLVRQQVRPGMTGWAQINGLRGDTSIEERVKYDIWYIENWSLWLDIKILWKTVFGGFLNSEVIDINNNEHK